MSAAEDSGRGRDVGEGRPVAGLDIGSVATKAVVWSPAAGVLGRGVQPTGWEPLAAAERALADALAQAGCTRADLAGIGATGYGRELVQGVASRATEVTCQARGVNSVYPAVRTVFDIGGQDSKAIRVDDDGNVLDFALNDRCAAGTGRFLEVMARALGMTLEALGEAAASATEACAISSTCTVFAESEVVGLLSQGHAREAVAAGLCHAIARQIIALAARIGIERPVAVAGGVARNVGVVAALARQLGEAPLVPPEPQFTVSLGAAILAREAIEREGRA